MAKINPQIFREYDIRGIVGEDLSQQVVYTLGRSYGTFLRNKGIDAAVVGRDNRLSSYAYSRAVIEGLVLSGISVTDIGMVTTPLMYFARAKCGIEGGAMVTGSHNPPEFNGLKLAYGPDTLYGDGIQEIRKIAASGKFVSGTGSVQEIDLSDVYVEDIASRVKLGPRKVLAVVDPGNGSSGPIVRKVLTAIGADFIEMFFEPDGTFPNHHPDPTRAKYLKQLTAKVLEEGADVGIAFDGDADRIGVVDNKGRLIWGDELQTVFWKEILPKYPGTLALIEIKCSQALVDVVNKLGGKPEFTRTGHSLIKARMRETGALFTGEMSGHMFFRDEYYGFDDAVYAAARLLRILTNTRESLDQMLADVPKYFSTPEVRVFCPDEDKFMVVEEISRQLSQKYKVNTVDGVRVMFNDGWGLIRASNTQPALVLRAEANTQERLERIKKLLEDKLGGFKPVGVINWE